MIRVIVLMKLFVTWMPKHAVVHEECRITESMTIAHCHVLALLLVAGHAHVARNPILALPTIVGEERILAECA